MIRLGQIGIGHNHGEAKMRAVRKFPDLFDVVGFAESDEAWIEKRGRLACYQGLERMPEDELLDKCDAILVETDVPRLTETAAKCISRGKHIHMDKPAADAKKFGEMLKEAEAKHLVVQMGYMYRYNPAVMQCLAWAKEGRLGEIYEINAEMSTFHGPEYKKWLTQFPGGIQYILGSHLVDLTVALLGKPERITSFAKQTGLDGVFFDDNNLAVLEYPKALARIYTSSVEVNGWGRRQLVVAGSKGTVQILPLENKTEMTYCDTSMTDTPYKDKKIVVPVEDVPASCRYDTMMQDFYDYIAGAKENPYSYAHDLAVQEVLDELVAGMHRLK